MKTTYGTKCRRCQKHRGTVTSKEPHGYNRNHGHDIQSLHSHLPNVHTLDYYRTTSGLLLVHIAAALGQAYSPAGTVRAHETQPRLHRDSKIFMSIHLRSKGYRR